MQKHALTATAAALAVALFAAGCTMAPHYKRPDAPVAQAYPAGGVYATQPGAAGARSGTAGRRLKKALQPCGMRPVPQPSATQ